MRQIAIVDDEQSVRTALTRLVRAEGMVPWAFASAQELFDAILDGRRLDCLVLDMQMPGLQGTDVQVWLRDRAIQVPTIVITGREDEPLRKRALALGARVCFCKPVSAETLLEAIHAAIPPRVDVA